MQANKIENDPVLQQVLWAYHDRWQRDTRPPDKRSICYSWVVRLYEERFGAKFHQSKLRQLARLGFLEQDETSRAGKRQYYRLVDPDGIERLLRKWGLL